MAVRIHIEPGCVMIHASGPSFDDTDAAGCVNLVKTLHEKKQLVIFDFTPVTSISDSSVSTLVKAVEELTKNEAKTTFVVQKPVEKTFKSSPFESLFQCYGSVDEVKKKFGEKAANNKESTLEFLNTSLEAVSYTLKVASNTDATAGKSIVRAPNTGAAAPAVDIGASVGIVSTPFNGTLILAFPMKTFLGIMGRLLGKECTELEPGITDGAAELLNIILGQARANLNEKGYSIKQAIPTVVKGNNLQMFNSSSSPSIMVPYTTDVGDFYIELTTRPANSL
jgi:chemotaxis protein CheX